MPETPSPMEAAHRLCLDLGLWGDPHFIADQQKAAAALDAYAAERVAETHANTRGAVAALAAERDAALAKLKAAEAEANRVARLCDDEAEMRATAERLLQVAQGTCNELNTLRIAAEERVRVLEASIDIALRFMPQHEPHTKILRDSRLAKAAAAPSEGGKG